MNLKVLLKIAILRLDSDFKDDLNSKGLKNDITTQSLIPHKKNILTIISNREDIILCGEYFISRFLKKNPSLKYKSFFSDGKFIKKNSKIAEIFGDAKIIFSLERTLLNFLQHLSSIATYTKKFEDLLKNSNTKLLDTRKTIPGLRKLQKYATMIAGCKNHRIGLFDDIIIKDNHIKVLGGIEKTLEILKNKKIKDYKIECDTFSQVKKCIVAKAKYIMLDNMSPTKIHDCVKFKNLKKSKVKFEISGGIDLNNLKQFSRLGADYISTSKITNCPKSVDIGLDII